MRVCVLRTMIYQKKLTIFLFFSLVALVKLLEERMILRYKKFKFFNYSYKF